MMAVGIVRGKPGVHAFEIPRPQIRQPDEVLIRIVEVGLDGTDFNILKFNKQDIAEDRNNMALGHEMWGVVEEVGEQVTSVARGDAVTMTVRRGCGQCHPCEHNQSDMCMTGLFTERGLHRLDGFLTEYVVDHEQYIVKVPSHLIRLAVLVEPLSIAEKAIDQIRVIQSRFPWSCAHPEHTFLSESWGSCLSALVVGAGPMGLTGIALLRLADVQTYVSEVVSQTSPKYHLATQMGAHFIDSRNKKPDEILNICCSPKGNVDIIFEAAGAADTAVQLMFYMSRGAIYVMTGIPQDGLTTQVDASQLVRQIVRYNQVIVGSVNSGRNHFEAALRDMSRIESRFPGVMAQILTHRFKLEEFEKAFSVSDPKHIKTVIEVQKWS